MKRIVKVLLSLAAVLAVFGVLFGGVSLVQNMRERRRRLDEEMARLESTLMERRRQNEEQNSASASEETLVPVQKALADAENAAVSGPAIPDAFAFFNGEVTHEDENVENGTSAFFGFDSDHAAAAYAYEELLENGGFGLTLTDTQRRDRSKGGGTYYYIFDVADEDLAQVSVYSEGYIYADVILKINDWPDYGWCDVVVWFSKDLTVTDTGARCSVTGLADRYEALAGPMGGKGARSGDADRVLRVGESVRLDCPRRFGANTEQFRWAVDEGADLVSLDGEISASCTVTAKAPGRAVVSVVYDHSYDTEDILTGNQTYAFDAPTYYFILEITQ